MKTIFKIINIKRRLSRNFKIKRYMQTHSVRKLQVGCGKHNLPGWLNVDIDTRADVYLDATKKFPFENRMIDFIFCEHFIEHLTKEQAAHFLKECHRVLKKDGIIRISTPDLELLMKTYLKKNPYVDLKDVVKRHEKLMKKSNITKAEWFNDKMRAWGHEFIYDFETLKKMLKECGFSKIKKCHFGKSEHKELQNLEKHADVEWMKNAEPLIIEAKNS